MVLSRCVGSLIARKRCRCNNSRLKMANFAILPGENTRNALRNSFDIEATPWTPGGTLGFRSIDNRWDRIPIGGLLLL